MPNWDIAEARGYHERIKHSFQSGSAHYLDWENWPPPNPRPSRF